MNQVRGEDATTVAAGLTSVTSTAIANDNKEFDKTQFYKMDTHRTPPTQRCRVWLSSGTVGQTCSNHGTSGNWQAVLLDNGLDILPWQPQCDVPVWGTRQLGIFWRFFALLQIPIDLFCSFHTFLTQKIRPACAPCGSTRLKRFFGASILRHSEASKCMSQEPSASSSTWHREFFAVKAWLAAALQRMLAGDFKLAVWWVDQRDWTMNKDLQIVLTFFNWPTCDLQPFWSSRPEACVMGPAETSKSAGCYVNSMSLAESDTHKLSKAYNDHGSKQCSSCFN